MDPIETTPRLPTAIGSGPHVGFLRGLLQSLTDIMSRSAVRVNATLPKDGTEAMTAPLVLVTYTVATLPTASSWPGGVIYVSDGAAGAKFRGSDGTSWVNLG